MPMRETSKSIGLGRSSVKKLAVQRTAPLKIKEAIDGKEGNVIFKPRDTEKIVVVVNVPSGLAQRLREKLLHGTELGAEQYEIVKETEKAIFIRITDPQLLLSRVIHSEIIDRKLGKDIEDKEYAYAVVRYRPIVVRRRVYEVYLDGTFREKEVDIEVGSKPIEIIPSEKFAKKLKLYLDLWGDLLGVDRKLLKKFILMRLAPQTFDMLDYAYAVKKMFLSSNKFREYLKFLEEFPPLHTPLTADYDYYLAFLDEYLYLYSPLNLARRLFSLEFGGFKGKIEAPSIDVLEDYAKKYDLYLLRDAHPHAIDGFFKKKENKLLLALQLDRSRMVHSNPIPIFLVEAVDLRKVPLEVEKSDKKMPVETLGAFEVAEKILDKQETFSVDPKDLRDLLAHKEEMFFLFGAEGGLYIAELLPHLNYSGDEITGFRLLIKRTQHRNIDFKERFLFPMTESLLKLAELKGESIGIYRVQLGDREVFVPKVGSVALYDDTVFKFLGEVKDGLELAERALKIEDFSESIPKNIWDIRIWNKDGRYIFSYTASEVPTYVLDWRDSPPPTINIVAVLGEPYFSGLEIIDLPEGSKIDISREELRHSIEKEKVIVKGDAYAVATKSAVLVNKDRAYIGHHSALAKAIANKLVRKIIPVEKIDLKTTRAILFSGGGVRSSAIITIKDKNKTIVIDPEKQIELVGTSNFLVKLSPSKARKIGISIPFVKRIIKRTHGDYIESGELVFVVDAEKDGKPISFIPALRLKGKKGEYYITIY